MKLSIVTSLYRSALHIDAFYGRVLAAAERLTSDLEIIFVNDGSPDESLEVCQRLLAHDARVVIVDLSRNFGQAAAVLTGLSFSTGDRVFLVDCDLEEPPEIVGDLWTALDAHPDADLAYGYQPAPRGGAVSAVTSGTYYRLLRWLYPALPQPADVLARLMTRRYAEAFVSLRAATTNLDVLTAWTGFRAVTRPMRKDRLRSSTFTLTRRTAIASEALLGHPRAWWAVLAMACGLVLSAASTALAAQWLVQAPAAPAGRVAPAVLVAGLCGGFALCLAGLAGLAHGLAVRDLEKHGAIVRAVYRHL